MKRLMCVFLGLLCSSQAIAGWHGFAEVTEMNIYGVSKAGTMIRMKDTTFDGCSRSSHAFVDATNPRYQDFMSALLAARIAGKPVKVRVSDCNGNYPVIVEMVL